MSAVSSVRTFGVLVTMIFRFAAASTSILSTPLPKFAMSFSFSPALPISSASILSVTVGTSTSASRIAAASSSALIARSSMLSRVWNSSRMRVSTGSGSRLVTITRGLALVIGGKTSLAPASGRFRAIHALNKRSGKRNKRAERPRWEDATGGSKSSHDLTPSLRSDDAALAAAVAISAATPLLPDESAAQDKTRGTGLPLPRFVSLKSNDVNVRRGPGQEYDVAYTYVREGLPVEITQEFDNWRKIRDSEGAEGWVFHSLLAGKRTALVAPWEASGPFAAYASSRLQGSGRRVS